MTLPGFFSQKEVTPLLSLQLQELYNIGQTYGRFGDLPGQPRGSGASQVASSGSTDLKFTSVSLGPLLLKVLSAGKPNNLR